MFACVRSERRRGELLSETGPAVGRGTLGATPWPDTSALYWTDLDLTAPSALGQYAWTVHVWGDCTRVAA